LATGTSDSRITDVPFEFHEKELFLGGQKEMIETESTRKSIWH
jgi:hypothetical protein